MGKGNRRKLRGEGGRRWEALPWRAVDTAGADMGDFGDSVFFGLEEIGGEELATILTAKGGSTGAQEADSEIAANKEEVSSEQKGKKAKKGIAENAEIDGDGAGGKQNKRKRKSDGEIEQLEVIAASTVDSGATKSNETKTKKKAVDKKGDAIIGKSIQKSTGNASAPVLKTIMQDRESSWGGLQLHEALVASMQSLNFLVPTRIQALSVPAILRGACDIVASSETGSGKTLAFGIPIIHSLLMEWSSLQASRSPYALILAPTRELAMQISSVLTDACKAFRDTDRRIEVVNVVGGMSEHKQRRQLDDTKGRGRNVHIMVATPGRLCELMTNNDDVLAFSDLSNIRFLVVDEADRMVEDGHFPELSRIFSRIRDHETLVQRGEDPVAAAAAARRGIDEDGFADGSGEGDGDDVPNPFDDEEGADSSMKVAFRADGLVSYDEAMRSMNGNNTDGGNTKGNATAPSKGKESKKRLQRQTLLFSATILAVADKKKVAAPALMQVVARGEALTHSKANEVLPSFLKQLLKTVAVQKNVRIIDSRATVDADGEKNATEEPSAKKSKVGGPEASKSQAVGVAVETEAEGVVNLPATLEQFEIRMPTEEKDIMAYYFLVAHPSRCLVFVNSIKTARRLDGLLRALGLNCRAVHSQLQQRQRLRALDSFRASPVGVLVATDIAARGLDIAKVQYVLHYDVARSVQVYVHRSGRTARAGSKGTTVSLVSPLDESHHADICNALKVPALPTYKVDLSVLPELRSHVTLAKKIFTKSFALSQKQKANNWLKDTMRGSGLEADDDLFDGVDAGTGTRDDEDKRGDNDDDGDGSGISSQKLAQFKREFAELEKSRREMKALIDRSIANGMYRSGAGAGTASKSAGGAPSYTNNRRKGAFIVVAR